MIAEKTEKNNEKENMKLKQVQDVVKRRRG
jgi:hypothetical protein